LLRRDALTWEEYARVIAVVTIGAPEATGGSDSSGNPGLVNKNSLPIAGGGPAAPVATARKGSGGNAPAPPRKSGDVSGGVPPMNLMIGDLCDALGAETDAEEERQSRRVEERGGIIPDCEEIINSMGEEASDDTWCSLIGNRSGNSEDPNLSAIFAASPQPGASVWAGSDSSSRSDGGLSGESGGRKEELMTVMNVGEELSVRQCNELHSPFSGQKNHNYFGAIMFRSGLG